MTSTLHGKGMAGIWQRYHIKFNKVPWGLNANRFGLLGVCPDLFITKTFATGNRILHLDPIQYVFWAWVVFGLEKPQGLLDNSELVELSSLAGMNAMLHLSHCRFRRLVCRLKLDLHSMIQGFYLLRVWDSQSRLCERVSYKIYEGVLLISP